MRKQSYVKQRRSSTISSPSPQRKDLQQNSTTFFFQKLDKKKRSTYSSKDIYKRSISDSSRDNNFKRRRSTSSSRDKTRRKRSTSISRDKTKRRRLTYIFRDEIKRRRSTSSSREKTKRRRSTSSLREKTKRRRSTSSSREKTKRRRLTSSSRDKTKRRRSTSSSRDKTKRRRSTSSSRDKTKRRRSTSSSRDKTKRRRSTSSSRDKTKRRRSTSSLSLPRKRTKRHSSSKSPSRRKRIKSSDSRNSCSHSLSSDSQSCRYLSKGKVGKSKNDRKICIKRHFGDCGLVLLFIPVTTTENEIRELFQSYHNKTKGVKLVQNKDGITMHAFVELETVSICRQFLDQKISGVVNFANCCIKVITENEYHQEYMNGFHLYSSPELPHHLQSDSFAKSLIENLPCNVLIIKSLKYSATEEQVRESIANLTKDAIYDVRVIKDKLTGQSRGFCFVEMRTVADAAKLLNIILRKVPVYTICNRRILAGFARMNTYSGNGISSLLPTTVDFFAQDAVSNVANNAIAAATSLQTNNNIITTESQMTYDYQSGYYFDSNTGYYYEPNSGYYYDSHNKTYLQYDIKTSQWIIIDTFSNKIENKTENKIQQLNQKSNKKANKKNNQKIKKENNCQNATDIAKSMEKWAKKQNVNKKRKIQLSNVIQSKNSYQTKGDDKNTIAINDPFVLTDRLICLLCIRKFKSRKYLEKHVTLSQLHKDNLILFNARTVASLEEASFLNKNVE